MYFVTLCVEDSLPWFGNIENGIMQLNDYGKIIQSQWIWLANQYDYVRLDEYVIMPDHIHGIIEIVDNRPSNTNAVGNSRDCSQQTKSNQSFGRDHSQQTNPYQSFGRDRSHKIKPISELIGAFKTTSARSIHNQGGHEFKWQKSFYDHIIRTETTLLKIRKYIQNNPIAGGNKTNNTP
jgi:REP-associated tyrosine transposase